LTSLYDSVQYAKGVGPKMAELLSKIGIDTIYDLISYPPFKYINREITIKKNFQNGEYITIVGEILDCKMTFTRRRMTIFTAVIKSENNYIYVKWFNNPYLQNTLKPKDVVVLSGVVKTKRGMYEMLHPEYEKFPEEDVELIHTGRIVPLYHLTKDLSQRWLRKVIKNAIDSHIDLFEEEVPEELNIKRGLIDIKFALKKIHYPRDSKEIERALEKMKYTELFYLGLKLAIKKEMMNEIGDFNYIKDPQTTGAFIEHLDFELTDDQKKAIKEIFADMKSSKAMNRLLMGDVGVGKTIVAVLAILYAIESGYQCALMVPTEVLAQQHYFKITKLLENMNIDIELLTSSIKENNRRLSQIESGEIKFVIGTHALIEDKVKFKNLKLVIIDEQHKFGVTHRSKLKSKGFICDYLVMTATPIPRSLSFVLYGDMNVSEIKEKPKMQKRIKTKWVSSKAIGKMYSFIEKRINAGESCFIVCPAINADEEADMESVEKIYNEIHKKYLKTANMGKIHSHLPQNEKQSIMEKMNNKEIDVLVGTTVIEVGIDIKDATVMVILSSERFGLSQLHQLRGRVGRDYKQSYCFLVSGERINEEGIKRLRTIANTNDGFEIAEMDLRMRGIGEAWGKKQSGIPQFRYADWFDDYHLMKIAFSDASEIISCDRNLLNQKNKCVKINLTRKNIDEID